MKIGNVDVRISIVAIGVFLVFSILLAIGAIYSPEVRANLIWVIPVLFMLLIIPLVLNYMSQKEYAALVPEYERRATPVKVKMINEGMIGKVVRVEGVVERVYFKFLNRPQYMIADRTGEISAKMFTSPSENINKGDVVEVLGTIIHRYVAAGDPVINCVSIKKIDKTIQTKKKV